MEILVNNRKISKIKALIFVFIILLGYSCKEAAADEINVITADEMETHLKYGEIQVVDVQTSRDFKKSHLLNSQNILFDKDFRKNLEKLDKDIPVAIYCTTGKISPEAATILQEAGFKRIYLLDGGIKKWNIEKQK